MKSLFDGAALIAGIFGVVASTDSLGSRLARTTGVAVGSCLALGGFAVLRNLTRDSKIWKPVPTTLGVVVLLVILATLLTVYFAVQPRR